MIQINLIPDLKAEYLKAQRTKNTVISISFLVSGAFIALVVLMFLHVNVNQKRHSDNLSSDITELSAQYNEIDDLDKVITIQKQLEALPGLHNTKPLVSRIAKYLTIITPEQIDLSDFELRFEDSSIVITGTGDDVPAVNIFADTIKNAIYTVTVKHEIQGEDGVSKGDTIDTAEGSGTALQNGNPGDEIRVRLEADPFSNVILDTISTDEEGAVFEILLEFDPQLFTNHGEINLIVPDIDSTLSERESPKIGDEERENDLFDGEEEEQ